jgi:UbiD family decarboxylase
MSAILTHLEKKKRFPLLFFENAEGGRAPVVINVMASRRLMAMAMETKPEELAACRSRETVASTFSAIEVQTSALQ